jgi:hypothetical protein
MSKLNPQKATAYVGPGVLRKGGKITKVPNGPLIKKKGPFKGSTLKSGGAIKKAASGLTTTTETTIDPKLKITRDSIKNEQRKIIWKKSYESSDAKKKGQDFDTWYKEFDQRTKENSKKAPEPKSERTFFGGDNGPKSPCKGGKCSGLNSSSRNGSTIKKAKGGGMIKRADGSMSKRGLWDNIRANKGSGKKPTKQMLVQEKKIKAKSKK